MQRRRELFGRQKTAKDTNNEDSGLSRDLPSVESDSCPKSSAQPLQQQEEKLSERVRTLCIQQQCDKPPAAPSLEQQPVTPTAHRRLPTFSLPRLFSQKKKDATIVTTTAGGAKPTTKSSLGTVTTTQHYQDRQQQQQLPPGTTAATGSVVPPVVDEQPQLSPSTTTTTSAYNTGADTGQESPPANTKKGGQQHGTNLDNNCMRHTVTAPATKKTTTMTTTARPPSMVPTLPRTKHPSRKQHVRFEPDSVSHLPQALFYTSAERLAETVATQQRLLHQELSSELLATAQQQQQRWHNDCLRQQQQQPKCHQQSAAGNGLKQPKMAQARHQQQNSFIPAAAVAAAAPQKQQQLQYPNNNHPKQYQGHVQYPNVHNTMPRQHQQRVQQYPPKAGPLPLDGGHETLPYLSPTNPPRQPQQQQRQQYQQLQYPKVAVRQTKHSATTLQQQQLQHEQTVQYPKETQRQQPAVRYPANEHRPQQKVPVLPQQQHSSSSTNALRQFHQIPYATDARRLQYPPPPPDNKLALHKTERRLTAEDVLSSIDHKSRHQNHPAANISPPLNISAAGDGGSYLTATTNWWACSNLAPNLPRPDWPRGAELAELFAFKSASSTAAVAAHMQQQQQQREKRRGSPSKHISGQHRQQPELEWVIKRRPDGTRYVTRRPTRKRATPSILAGVKARREQSLAHERAGMSTTDDDGGGSEAFGRNAGGVQNWWTAQRRRKPPPIPSPFLPSSLLARKKVPSAPGAAVGDVSRRRAPVGPQSDVQKAFTVTTV